MKIILLLLLPVMCLSQPKESKILQIGDKVPNMQFTNADGTTFYLNDMKSEAVLLDFWASWCGSCIARWSDTDSLKAHYGSKINVILIASMRGEKGEADSAYRKLKRYSSRITHLKYFAMKDSVADKFFYPHAIPHYVWLRREQHEKNPAYYVNGFTSGGFSIEELMQYAYMDDLKPKAKP